MSQAPPPAGGAAPAAEPIDGSVERHTAHFFGTDQQGETSRAPRSQYSRSLFLPHPSLLIAREVVDSLACAPTTRSRKLRLWLRVSAGVVPSSHRPVAS